MSKEYGLIIPGKKAANGPPIANLSKPSVFGSDSESDDNAPKLRVKTTSIGPGANEKRIAKKIQAQALEQDPTVFQYDELYDEMENKREEEKKSKSSEVKKPKYINRLLEYAEKRKLDNERRVERMVQKERELEGDEFKDKESFVTSAYRQKLEAMRKAEEQEKRDTYLESIGDVTKQKDLDGFYRHLYEQKLGTKDENLTTNNESKVQNEKSKDLVNKKSISTKSRAYRKRRASNDQEEELVDLNASLNSKTHIQCNIDADSDFSIDSSDSENENTKAIKKDENKSLDAIVKEEVIMEAADSVNNETTAILVTADNLKTEESLSPKQEEKTKKIKIDIWKKRTVGAIFDAALQRYYERKATRNG